MVQLDRKPLVVFANRIQVCLAGFTMPKESAAVQGQYKHALSKSHLNEEPDIMGQTFPSPSPLLKA